MVVAHTVEPFGSASCKSMLVSGGRANLHDAFVPLREGSSCFNLSTPRAQDWLSPQGINARAKWRNWCRQMLLLIYLRPLWHSVGQYLQDYSNLQDPAKNKKKPDRRGPCSSCAASE